MRALSLQLRFLLPLLLTLVLAAWLALPLMDRLTLRWFSRDLNIRGALVTTTLSDAIGDALERRKGRAPEGAVRPRRAGRTPVRDRPVRARRHPAPPHRQLPAEPRLRAGAGGGRAARPAPAARRRPGSRRRAQGDGEAGPVAELVLLHDFSFIDRRSQDTRRYLSCSSPRSGSSIALITVVVAQLSWRGWVSGARGAAARRRPAAAADRARPELAPLAAEIRARLRDLEDEYRRRTGRRRNGTPSGCARCCARSCSGDEVIVVSNREPYIHERRDGERRRAATGERPGDGGRAGDARLLGNLDRTWQRQRRPRGRRQARPGPVPPGRGRVRAAPRLAHAPRRSRATTTASPTRACGRCATSRTCARCSANPTGSGTAGQPALRRRRGRRGAQRGPGRSGAGLPLRPAAGDDPRAPAGATILTFWHIPWPNPESFGICPWRREILEGMLGSTILGFHTRFHCKNFLETVDRYLEARIEHEHSTISFQGAETLVESYPISIEWPSRRLSGQVAVGRRVPAPGLRAAGPAAGSAWRSASTASTTPKASSSGCTRSSGCSRSTRNGSAASSSCRSPRRRAARSRSTTLPGADRARLAGASTSASGGRATSRCTCSPQHHEHDAVIELYRAADVCLVTSLHDGMNLVCKEFVAARNDEQGVLILSRFAGAARELTEALIVNPYHVEECADALHRAATMPPAEQRERMASLRMTVRESNVYRWAGHMLSDAGRWRQRQRIEARVLRHHAA